MTVKRTCLSILWISQRSKMLSNKTIMGYLLSNILISTQFKWTHFQKMKSSRILQFNKKMILK